MTSISASTSPLAASISRAASAGAMGGAATISSNPAGSGGGDHLAAMRPALDSVAAVGSPMDSTGAASVLATGGSYLAGAAATIGRIEDGIAKRTKALEGLAANGGSVEEITKAGEQIDLLQRLRDRIQLSIDRVGDILAGNDRDDIGGPEGADAGDAKLREQQRLASDAARRKADEQALLEQRLQVLGSSATAGLTSATPDSGLVAATYRAGGAPAA